MLNLKHKYLFGLGTWLAGLTLSGRESRERTKFLEQVNEQLRENDAVRLEIVKKYAEVENGEPKLVKATKPGEQDHYVVPDDKLEEFNKEATAYFDEEWTFGGPGDKNRLKVVKNLVLETNEMIKPEVASDYDAWCEAFEKVEFPKE